MAIKLLLHSILIIKAALALIAVIGYLGTWIFGGKQMKKEQASFNEEEKPSINFEGFSCMYSSLSIDS